MYRVLFVCSGNICRSPTAEGVFRVMADAGGLATLIAADSAGIGDWHVGAPPDQRSQAAALARGYDISRQRARQVAITDFTEFDMLVGMDSGHVRDLEALAPSGELRRVHLFLDFAAGFEGGNVPDPYFGGPDGFEAVLEMIEAGSQGLLSHIRDVIA